MWIRPSYFNTSSFSNRAFMNLSLRIFTEAYFIPSEGSIKYACTSSFIPHLKSLILSSIEIIFVHLEVAGFCLRRGFDGLPVSRLGRRIGFDGLVVTRMARL